MQLTPNVLVNQELGVCNLSLITTKEGLVAIDTPNNIMNAVKWRDEIKSKGNLRYLINTEEHGDHTTGTFFLPGILVSSRATREFVAKTPSKEFKERTIQHNPALAPVMEKYEMRLADITFDERLELYLGDHTFILFPLPGHTPGGIGVYIPQERVVICCDVIFCQCKTWFQMAEPEKWLVSLEKLSQLDVDHIVPGHGPVCNKDYLAEEAKIVNDWITAVKNAIARGWSAEEAVARMTIPDPYPKQSSVGISEEDINRRSIMHLYELYSGKH